MPPTEPRIAPLSEATDELRDIFRKVLSHGGEVLNIFKILGKHPRLLKRWNTLGGLFLSDGLLPPREREIVILRVGWQTRCVYEFGQHTLIGRRAGLTEEEITRLAQPPVNGQWGEDDRVLIRMADELCASDRVGAATWVQLVERWNEPEIIELVMLTGYYRMVSGFLNSVGVPREAGVPGWPAGAVIDAGEQA